MLHKAILALLAVTVILSRNIQCFSARRGRWRLSCSWVPLLGQPQLPTQVSSCSATSADAIWMATLFNSDLRIGAVDAALLLAATTKRSGICSQGGECAIDQAEAHICSIALRHSWVDDEWRLGHHGRARLKV